jgi:hypothetical protein
MALDIYAGPISRYVAGSWNTVVQQAGGASGIPVVTIRPGEPLSAIDFDAIMKQAAVPGMQPQQPTPAPADVQVVADTVSRWRAELMRNLGVNEEWNEDVTAEFYTDQPGWHGYGAVVLLAAYDEQPNLAPGAKAGLFRSRIPAVSPDRFGDAQAFKVASQNPAKYPTLLLGAEWCLPLVGGPTVFPARTPNGSQITMGHVDRLVEELDSLNQRTLRLSDSDLEAARFAGPSSPNASVESMAPFGLGVLISVARFAAKHRVAWIMDS